MTMGVKLGDRRSGPAAMKVKIEDRSLLSELVDYLRRCDCTVGFNDGLLEVRLASFRSTLHFGTRNSSSTHI
jgi:hypothetical protein